MTESFSFPTPSSTTIALLHWLFVFTYTCTPDRIDGCHPPMTASRPIICCFSTSVNSEDHFLELSCSNDWFSTAKRWDLHLSVLCLKRSYSADLLFFSSFVLIVIFSFCSTTLLTSWINSYMTRENETPLLELKLLEIVGPSEVVDFEKPPPREPSFTSLALCSNYVSNIALVSCSMIDITRFLGATRILLTVVLAFSWVINFFTFEAEIGKMSPTVSFAFEAILLPAFSFSMKGFIWTGSSLPW